MCRFSGEQLRELEGAVAHLVAEQEGHVVREDLAQQPACQVPQVARPHLLYTVASHELREDDVYPVAEPAEEDALHGALVELLGGVRGHELDAHARQLLLGLRRMVVAIPDDQAGGSLGEFGDDRELVDVGRGHRKTGDETRPADPRVYPETVQGLPEPRVLAEGGLSPEATTAVGAGEQTPQFLIPATRV
jgi:hypothetical protein